MESSSKKQQQRISQEMNELQIENQASDRGLSDPLQRQVPPQIEQMNDEEYHQYANEIEENSKRIINRQQRQEDLGLEEEKEVEEREEERPVVLQPVKNPVSAYMIFVTRWKAENPNQKFNMSHLGELWQSFSPTEKREFEDEYRKRKIRQFYMSDRRRYDEYVAQKLINNPNPEKDDQVENKFLFPLHRIKSIMKQDKAFMPKTDAVVTMSKATEFFGEFFLEELKKITEGRARIDTNHLFECINFNQRSFGFLECLIDDYVENNNHNSKKKAAILESSHKKGLMGGEDQVEFQPIKDKITGNKQRGQGKQRGRKPTDESNKKGIGKGQMNLTEMFDKAQQH